MSSEVKANKISPATGTALQISDSGDTTTIPSGATLDVSSATMTGFTIPSGQTLTVASGATIANSGTATGFGSDNTPAFQAYRSTNQTISHDTYTKVECQTEDFDTGSGYDNSSTYLYTVPSGEGGVYWIYFHLDYASYTNSSGNYGALQIRVNSETASTASFSNWWNLNSSPGRQWNGWTGGMRTLSAGDTIGFYAYGWDNGTNPYTIQGGARRDTLVGAYKMLGIS